MVAKTQHYRVCTVSAAIGCTGWIHPGMFDSVVDAKECIKSEYGRGLYLLVAPCDADGYIIPAQLTLASREVSNVS